MAFRGLFFTEEHEHLDVFAVDLHETGPSGGDVHWRGAATGESRASFEGLIQIDPGAQQTHTYLQIHSMMLSPKARIDAIPSVLVSADDVSASHGGTVGELDETAIFYMQTRGLDRPAAVRVIVEGFFEPLIAELADEPLEELVRAKVADEARGRARGHRGVCHQSLSSSLARPRRLPDPRARPRRAPAGLPRLGRHLAEAPGRDRRARRAPARAQRQRPPRRLRARPGGRRGLRGRARADRRASPAPTRETTIFTKNVTEAINLVAYAWGRANVGPGDAVLITQMEHHANIVPWQVLCRERGAELRYLEVDERGELSLEALDAELARGDVRLVAFAHVSNVLGTINPVAEIVARARAAGAVSLIDGAQAVPQMPVDVEALGADFYAWTGHKALGPTGIGVLHGRRELLERDGAVPDRRRHDRLGRPAGGDLERAAVEVRSGHAR